MFFGGGIVLFLFCVGVCFGCASPGQKCESWWRWDSSEGCQSRGCCPVDLFSCVFPSSASVLKRVHVVQGCHFDAGFVAPIQDILNRWFHEFFPLALKIGSELAALATGPHSPQLKFTAQSWIVQLFLNCPREYELRGVICPTQEEIKNFSLAVTKGFITWHAFPHNAEVELGDVSLVDFGIQMTHLLDDSFGLPRKTVMSQRDVPGMTKSIIPILKRNGVGAISVGSNGGSAPVNVPNAFTWKFNSTMSVRAFWLGGGYSGFSLPHRSALTQVGEEGMVVLWRGDNAGPPTSASEVISDWKRLQNQFPGVDIVSSSFDEFFAASQSVPDSELPQLAFEIGDTWIYGAASDPVKSRDMQILNRLRSECEALGSCSLKDERFFNFSVMALKNIEHTWGRDHKVVLGADVHSNWTNADFAKNVVTEKYQNLSDSWIRQYDFGIVAALHALGDHELKSEIELALAQARKMPEPKNFSSWKSFSGPVRVKLSATHSIDFDVFGNAVRFVDGNSSVSGQFGTLQYTTYGQNSYREFARSYNFGWPILIDEYDFLKQNLPNEVKFSTTTLTLSHGFIGPNAVLLTFAAPSNLVTEAGAAPVYHVLYELDDHAFQINVIVANKTSTRLPESTSILFKYPLCGNWTMTKLGHLVDPKNVATGGSKHLHHVEQLSCGSFSMKPDPAALVSFGTQSSFPTPIDSNPTFDSVNLILHSNLWNTNYVGWFPYALDQQVNFKTTIMIG